MPSLPPSRTELIYPDWRVAGGLVNGVDSYNTFQSILANASAINTGFVVHFFLD